MSDGMAIETPDHDSTRNASLSVKPCPKCTRPTGALALSVRSKTLNSVLVVNSSAEIHNKVCVQE